MQNQAKDSDSDLAVSVAQIYINTHMCDYSLVGGTCRDVRWLLNATFSVFVTHTFPLYLHMQGNLLHPLHGLAL